MEWKKKSPIGRWCLTKINQLCTQWVPFTTNQFNIEERHLVWDLHRGVSGCLTWRPHSASPSMLESFQASETQQTLGSLTWAPFPNQLYSVSVSWFETDPSLSRFTDCLEFCQLVLRRAARLKGHGGHDALCHEYASRSSGAASGVRKAAGGEQSMHAAVESRGRERARKHGWSCGAGWWGRCWRGSRECSDEGEEVVAIAEGRHVRRPGGGGEGPGACDAGEGFTDRSVCGRQVWRSAVAVWNLGR